MRPLDRIPLALLAFAVFACTDADTPQSPSEFENITLSLRIHLLQSGELTALNSTLSDADVEALVAGVNEIWAQAAITWEIESILREPAQNAESYAAVLRGESAPTGQALASVFPKDNLLPAGWNVFVINDLGSIAGGIYLGQHGAVLFAQFGPIGLQSPTGAGRRILAHELGHSLGLAHVPCTSAGNLMSPGCAAGDRTRLTPTQIRVARLQAEAGRPFGFQAAAPSRVAAFAALSSTECSLGCCQ